MATAEAPSRRERPGKAAILRAAVEVMGEDGYEGASMRDMAARAGVSVAALYHHFPSKLDLLREFLDEAYDVILARVDRRLLGAGPSAAARLDEIVATLIASLLHNEFARLAANVAWREHTRLDPPERRAVDAKRRHLLSLVESVVADGVAGGEFTADEPREAARAIVTLATTLVEPFGEMNRPMPEVIVLYQRFARAIACTPPGAGGGAQATG
jgi:AcrR family transcriptional regulator